MNEMMAIVVARKSKLARAPNTASSRLFPCDSIATGDIIDFISMNTRQPHFIEQVLMLVSKDIFPPSHLLIESTITAAAVGDLLIQAYMFQHSSRSGGSLACSEVLESPC